MRYFENLYFFGRWMHAPTQKLELVDASADPKNSRWMQPMTVILELVDVSTDPRRGLIMPTIQ